MRHYAWLVLFILCATSACAGQTPATNSPPALSQPTVTASPSAIATTSTPTTLEVTATATTSTANPPTAPLQIRLVEFVRGAQLRTCGNLPDPPRVSYITNAGDGSERIFVVEQEGLVCLVKDGGLVTTPFLDIRDRVTSASQEQGLLNLVFPPDPQHKNYFYLDYVNKQNQIILSRWRVTANPDRADAQSEQVILQIDHSASNAHYAGQLSFGPRDGYLYAGVGDAGRPDVPSDNAQRLDTSLGKVLRLDTEKNLNGASTIPPDNPFVNTPNARGEIWAYGLRNPWRFAFDPLTGDLFVGDVGENRSEEIDWQPASSHGGENYGWDILEGDMCLTSSENCQPPLHYVPPVATYAHAETNPKSPKNCAIIGGGVYYRPQPQQSSYLFGDWCGDIRALTRTQGQWQMQILLPTAFYISTFGLDEAGNMYVADYYGRTIYRMEIK